MTTEERIIDLLSGELAIEEKQETLRLIDSNINAKKIYHEYKKVFDDIDKAKLDESKPSAQLKSNFDKLIAKEEQAILKKKAAPRIVSLSAIRKYAAVAAVLVIGIFLGNNYINNNQSQAIKEELAFLKNQIDQNIASSSVSTRIKAVNYSKELPAADPTILDIIIKTGQQDKNANVRLAAILALANHLNAPNVPNALGQMLINENDPAVKIAIIETVSKIKSKDILQSLELLTQDNSLPQYIQDEAHHGMTILQHGEIF